MKRSVTNEVEGHAASNESGSISDAVAVVIS